MWVRAPRGQLMIRVDFEYTTRGKVFYGSMLGSPLNNDPHRAVNSIAKILRKYGAEQARITFRPGIKEDFEELGLPHDSMVPGGFD